MKNFLFKNKKKKADLNLYSHSVVKLREASQMFMMVDYVRQMTSENGPFEQLLFLCEKNPP